ncbi:MAG: diaminopimelate epimerase [marine bacterium B5-7]|nr:MAG: diaminopimelate epimerase [marine bacterium B5-7]
MKIEHWSCAGNKILIIDGRSENIAPEVMLFRVQNLYFDQALLIDASKQANTVAHYRIFNCDGSEAEQCGNGALCLAHYLWDEMEIMTRPFTLTCVAGEVLVRETNEHQLQIGLTAPTLKPAINVDGLTVYPVSVGNPHWVIPCDDLNDTARLQAFAENHLDQNIEFIQQRENHIKARVFERGAGETQACGSGSLAIAAVSHQQYQTRWPIEIKFPGGTLSISVDETHYFLQANAKRID